MSLKYVTYCAESRLSCTGCLPADVIVCVRPEIVAPQLLCDQGLAESAFPFSYIEAVVIAVSKDTCSNKFKYTLEYDSAQIVVGVLEVVSADITGIFCKGCLTSWVEEKIGNEVYVTTNEFDENVIVTQHGCEYVLSNVAPSSTFVYIGYASDAIGTDFTLVPDVTSTYINFLSTTDVLTPPVLADFDPLQWAEYVGADGAAGAPGAPGTPGANGDSAYVYVGYASDNIGTNFSLTPIGTSTYINFLSTSLVLAPPVLGDFDPLQWAEYEGPAGVAGPIGPVGPAGPAGSSGTSPVGDIAMGFWQVAPTDYLPMLGDTLGSAASAATYANALYVDLYSYLWDNLSDAEAPVSSGRGASAAADFAANKTITIVDTRGFSPLGQTVAGAGSTLGGTLGALEHDHSVDAHYHSMGTGATLSIIASGAHTTAITHDHAQFNTTSAGTHVHSIADPGHVHDVNTKGVGAVAGNTRIAGATSAGVNGQTTDQPVRSEVTGITVTSTGSAHAHAIDVPLFTGNSASTGLHIHTAAEFAGTIGLVTGGQNGNTANDTSPASHSCFVVKYYIRYQ